MMHMHMPVGMKNLYGGSSCVPFCRFASACKLDLEPMPPGVTP